MRGVSAALLAALLAPLPAAALEFDVRTGQQRTVVHARGTIEAGDAERLRSILSDVPEGGAVLVIDSPGGRAVEGARIAQIVAARRMPVAVGGMCASACFLALAASPQRMAFPHARIGVHSAYLPDVGETRDSMALTTLMARGLLLRHPALDHRPDGDHERPRHGVAR